MDKVSVIIPTKNRQELLKKNLTALSKQTVLPNEVIVADNGSIDDTKKVVHSFHDKLPIKYLFVKESGVTHARNNAVKIAKHEIVAFLDDDCEAKKDWVEKIKKNKRYLKDYVIQGKSINPNKNSIISEVMYFCSETGIRIGISESKIIKNVINSRPIFFDFIDTKNLIMSKEIIKKVGILFDNSLEKYNYGEDTELGIRLHMLGISSVYCDDIITSHNYISSLLPLIIKSFLLGQAQVSVIMITTKKHKLRYEKESKYAALFGREKINAILKKRMLRAKLLSNKYLKEQLAHFNFAQTCNFKILLKLHTIFKHLGIIYQKLLYKLKYILYNFLMLL